MPNELETLIQQRLAELPQDVRRAIESADLHARITEIGTEHKLHVDQVGALEDETLLVMLGFSDPAEFPDTLQKHLSISAEEAALIANNINEEVFQTIRDSMRTFMESREEPAPAPPPTSPKASQGGAPQPQRPPAPQPSPVAPPPGARPMQAPPQKPFVSPPPPASLGGTQGIALSVPLAPATPKAPPMPSKPVPLNPLGGVQDKLSNPSVTAAKPFDLSLKTNNPQQTTNNGQPPSNTQPPSQPPKKNYTKDPYREPVE